MSAETAAQFSVPQDSLGRRFSSLRLSLTARCNFACRYCVADARSPRSLTDELTADEMSSALRLLVQLGIEKLRITGGEPLLSDHLLPVLQAAVQLPLRDIALTTNGALLADRLPLLAQNGVGRINLSLDTLDADRFRRMSRSNSLDRVLAGLEQALDEGISLKINTVLMRGQNEGDILPLLEFSAERGIEQRYIELMRMGHLYQNRSWRESFVGRDEILAAIAERWEFAPLPTPADATAQRWQLENGAIFGIIANESAPFCSGCDRLRLTADGKLYGCISSHNGISLRPLLRLPEAEALRQLSDVLSIALRDKSPQRFRGGVSVMKILGG